MATAIVIGPRQKPKIGNIELSAAIREVHNHRADVTDAPVERGSVISDHRRVYSGELSLEAIVSSVPLTSRSELTDDGDVIRGDQDEAGQTSRDAFERLRQLFEAEDVFDVVTSIRFYERMQFTRFVVTCDETTGNAISFSAELRRIDVVDSAIAVVAAPAEAPKVSEKSDRGKQSTTDAPPGVERTVADEIGHTLSDGADPAATFRTFLNRVLGP